MNFGIILGLFPGVLSMIAVYFILKSLGLTDLPLALVMVYSGSSGLGSLVVKGFFYTIPKSLDEAAKILCRRCYWKLYKRINLSSLYYTQFNSLKKPYVDNDTYKV